MLCEPGDLHAAEPPTTRRTAPRLARTRRGEIRGRLLFREIRRNPCAGHRHARGSPAAMAQRPRARLGHRRIRHAAARDARAHPPRGLRRQAERAHRRNPAPDRAQPALRGRSQGDRGAADHDRLRRDPGRRRHAHSLDHRRLDRALRLPGLDEDARHVRRQVRCAIISPRFPAACAAARPCSISTMPRIRRPTPMPISS